MAAFIPYIGGTACAKDAAAQPVSPVSLASHTGVALQAAGGDIVVTATRRTVLLEDVPFSMVALSGDTLEQQQIRAPMDLVRVVPGLQFSNLNRQAAQFSLRGAYNGSFAAMIDQDIGVFIDDVYAPSGADVSQEFFDLDRIEVLKGPQGTLFGRNVTGGAVVFHTRRPSFVPQAELRSSYGRFGDYKVQALVSGPVTDGAALKLVGNLSGNRGYIRNIRLGGRAGEEDQIGLRGQLLIEPGDGLSILLGASYLSISGEPTPSQLFGAVQPGLIWPTLSYSPNETMQDASGRDITQNIDAHDFLLRVEAETGIGTITSISGYRWNRLAGANSAFGDPLATTVAETYARDRQFTQELRLASDPARRLSYVLGAYYYRANKTRSLVVDVDYRPFGPPYPGRVPVIGNLFAPDYVEMDSHVDQSGIVRSEALFAEAQFRLTPQLTLTAGARYTWEHKNGSAFRSHALSYISGPQLVADFGADWQELTPKATISFEPNDDFLFYLTATRGFKAGAFDNNAPTSVAALQTAAQPTTVWNYEAGARAALFSKRVRINAAVFRMDYTDLQVRIFDPALAGFAFKNADSARVEGIELDGSAQVTGWLQLGGNLAYQDARYRAFVPDPTAPAVNNNGKRMVNTPRWSGSLWTNLNWKTDSGGFEAGANIYFRSKIYLTENNSEPDYLTDRTRARGVLDLNASWTSPDDRFKATIWGKNVTNKRYLLGFADVSSLFLPAPTSGAIFYGTWNQRPTYGVTISYRLGR